MNLYQSDIDALKSNVAFICVFKGSEYFAIGTTFLLSITEENHVFEYWITCKHVVEEHINKGMPLYLRLNERGGTVAYIPMQGEWVYHPNKDVDIAVLHWLSPQDMPAYEIQAIDAEREGVSPDKEPLYKDRVREGHEVTLLGLFPKYFGEKRNLPMFRFGKISLVTSEKTTGHYGDTEHFFVECDVWPGASGSPVFVGVPENENTTWSSFASMYGGDPPINYPNELFVFYGVATVYYPHEARSKKKRKKINGKEEEINEVVIHYGISLVTPSDKVTDVLYGDTMKDKREQKKSQSINLNE